MKIRDLKMGTKLYSSFFIVIFVLGMVSVFQIIQMGNLKELEDQSAQRNDDSETISKIKETSDEFYLIIADGIINRDIQNTLKDFEEIKGRIVNARKQIKELADTEEERAWADEIAKDFESYQSLFEQKVLPELRNGTAANMDIIRVADGEIDKVRSDLETQLVKFEDSLDKEGKAASAAYDETYSMVLWIVFAVLAIGVVIGAAFAFVMTRYIKKNLQEVVDLSGKLAVNNLTGRVDLTQSDEFGMVAQALNKAMDNLENLMGEIISGMQNLAQAVEQISSGNQNLSQRTSEQASSLEEVASTVEQATATINQNAENATKARELTDTGTSKSKDGNRIALEAVESINEMNDSSKKVAEIISVINDIAFQTNLLALNAAVEAARAGEQGRGFAVVAGEVRNLAQRSGNAAKEIENLIKDTVNKVEKGTELVNRTGESLNEIAIAAEMSAQLISEIAMASQEQKQGIGQINTAITELDDMTQQNASLVEETASASEEMSNQAEELLEMVRQFTISDTSKLKDISSKHHEIHLKAAELGRTQSKIQQKSGDGNGRKSGKKETQNETLPGRSAAKDKEDKVKSVLLDEGFEEF